MRTKPAFFSRVARQSQDDWQKLETNPNLRGPWERLFQQVQQPDHVISELLQNADDAGATWVGIQLFDNVFVLKHNGRDFDEESLSAISSFANSSKTMLHTIGQWGIGFKSVFSLGQRVEILTPNLAFAFHKDRYIIPEWIPDADDTEHTIIRIYLEDDRAIHLARKQIQRWKEDALPLLFFNHIEALEIDGIRHAFLKDQGPTQQSQWAVLEQNTQTDLILFIQDTVSYTQIPQDVRDDILQQLPSGHQFPENTVFPISLVLGEFSPRRLYVVLPTNNHIVSLPFSLSAPFIQDPGRTGIQKPSQSLANAWFMEQLGRLAARNLHEWLCNTTLSLQERAQAYQLLPPSPRAEQAKIDGDIVGPFLRAFAEEWEQAKTSHFLTVSGNLVSAYDCVDVPAALFDVWDAETLIKIFAENDHQQLAAKQITQESRTRLSRWSSEWEHHSLEDIFEILKDITPPKPDTWLQLAHLWQLAAQVLSELPWIRRWDDPEREWPLLPAQGKTGLYPAHEVLPPLGEKEKQFTPEELDHLLPWVMVVDTLWRQYLDSLPEDNPAATLKRTLNLSSATSKEPLFHAAAKNFFQQNAWEQQDGLRWAWIAARMDIAVPKEGFRYLCRDGKWRSPESYEILGDISPELDEILPETWLEQHALHESYWTQVPSDYRDVWHAWIRDSRKSRLQQFVRVKSQDQWIYNRTKFEEICRQRGGHPAHHYPRVRQEFIIQDYVFAPELWKNWEESAAQKPTIWAQVLRYILSDWDDGNWEDRLYVQNTYQYSTRADNRLDTGQMLAQWIMRLREHPCVLDENGQPHLPHEVYRRNSNTEALRGTVAFLHPDMDKPEWDALYHALGVPDHPQNADIFVQRLQTWSGVSEFPIGEIGKLYDRIAGILPRLPEDARQELVQHFREEPLLLGDDQAWHRTKEIYQRNPDNLPGITTLHPGLPEGLSAFWSQIGINLEPTWTTVLDWLMSLPENKPLNKKTRSKLRKILKARPQQVWQDTQHWINGAGEWVSADQLQYAGTERDLSRLFPHIKRLCADAGSLDDGFHLPFPSLTNMLEYRPLISTSGRNAASPPWLTALAEFLGRVVLENEETAKTAISQAKRLARTTLIPVPRLQVVAYLNGEAVGPEFNQTVLWHETHLYFEKEASYENLTGEVGRYFPGPLQKAIHAMWHRSPREIQEYFEQEFGELREASFVGEEDADLSLNDPSQPALQLQKKQIPLPEPSVNTPSPQNPHMEMPIPEPEPTEETSPKDTPSPAHHTSQTPASASNNWDRFWMQQHFVPHNGVWVNPQTNERLERLRGHPMQWARHSAGKTTWYYAPRNGSFRQGVEILAETWHFIQSNPEQTCLVLWDADQATVLTGTDILHKVKSEEIQMFPALYRLRLVDDML